MKNIADNLVKYLPAFPGKPLSEDEASEFLVKFLDQCVNDSRELKTGLKRILFDHKLYRRGMSNEDMLQKIKDLVDKVDKVE